MTGRRAPQRQNNKESPEPVAWRFSKADKSGPWPWPEDREEQIKIISFMREVGTQTIDEIRSQKKNNHSIEIAALAPEAQRRLDQIKLGDIDSVFSMRVDGTSRIICLVEGSVIGVLWWDPRHQVCPSRKKHT